MTTDFCIKRWSILFTAVLLGCIISISCYAYYVYCAEFLWVGKSFYFLVSYNPHVEVAVHTARLEGGAGYLLFDGREEYTVYSVYLRDDIARTVQAGMQDEAMLVEKDVEYLVFKGRDKRFTEFYHGALNGLYGCIEVLSKSITMLENGAVQQTCKRILTILEKQFAYMATTYKEDYPTFAQVCETVREGLNKILLDVVYCKDLRYVLCMACDGYLQLSSKFSL